MIYSWKCKGLYPVDAQTAGSELDRIYQQNGKIDPQSVVDESEPETAPLHKCFEWNNDKAANEYRKQQARVMIAQITVVHETSDETPVAVRAFINTEEDYQPLNVVLRRPDLKEQMMENALHELSAFKRKYSTLASLKPVMDAIDTVVEQKTSTAKKKSCKSDNAERESA